MLIDKPQIVENSSIVNATIASGNIFPGDPSTGELFYAIALGGDLPGPPTGLYVFNGVDWEIVAVGPEQQDPDLTHHIADQGPHLNPHQKALLDGISVAFGDVNKVTGLETFLGPSATLPMHLTSVGSTLTSINSQLTTINNTLNTKMNTNGSTPMTGNLNLGGFTLVNAAPPTGPNDLVTKAYVDSIVSDAWVRAMVATTLY